MITLFDKNTLGKNGQIIATTKCYIKCDNNCSKTWTTTYSNLMYKPKDFKNYCQSCKNKLGICGMKDKKHTKTTIQNLIKNAKRGDINPSKRPEVRAKISQKLKGKPCPFKGKKRPEHSLKMKKFMTKVMNPNNDFRNDYMIKLLSSQRKFISKLHNNVKKFLLQNNITEFESEKFIGYYHVDECNEKLKLIIEIQGNYWHANPAIYKADDIINHKTAKQIWKKDNIKKKFLENKGYKIYYIWEKDFKDNPNKVIEDVKKFIS